MRFDSHDYDDTDGELVTTVFFQAEPTVPEPARGTVSSGRISPPVIRSYEVADRFAIPTPKSFAPTPVLVAPTGSAPRRTRHLQTVLVRRARVPLLGLGYAGVCVLVGIAIGGLIVLTGNSSAVAHVAVEAPRAATPVAPVPIAPISVAPAARPSLVTVRVESTPPGATATLVERGKSTLVGITPIDAELDRAHGYEMVLELAGHETQTVRLDPAKRQQVMVALTAIPEPAPIVSARGHHVVPARAR